MLCWFLVGRPMVKQSKGMRCLGERPSGRKCRRARNSSSTAVLLNKVCQHCGEQRCKAHCKCAGQGTENAKGRKAARGIVQRSTERSGGQSSVPEVVAARAQRIEAHRGSQKAPKKEQPQKQQKTRAQRIEAHRGSQKAPKKYHQKPSC